MTFFEYTHIHTSVVSCLCVWCMHVYKQVCMYVCVCMVEVNIRCILVLFSTLNFQIKSLNIPRG